MSEKSRLSELQLPMLSMSETARIFAKLQRENMSYPPQQRLNQANNKLNKPQTHQRRHSSCDHKTVTTKINSRPRTTSDKTETFQRSQETKIFILDEVGVQKVDNLKVKVTPNEYL